MGIISFLHGATKARYTGQEKVEDCFRIHYRERELRMNVKFNRSLNTLGLTFGLGDPFVSQDVFREGVALDLGGAESSSTPPQLYTAL